MIKKLIEKKTGIAVSDEALAMAAQDIIFNRVRVGKRTSLSETIKIAAACAGTLARCG